MDEQREKDIQALCDGVLSSGIESTGDYGQGGQCPFCLKDCRWDANIRNIEHERDCIYLIAKDLSTRFIDTNL